MLRVDPGQRQRLAEIVDNLRQRLHEAHERRWLGEIQGLQISLDSARAKLATVGRLTERPDWTHDAGPAQLSTAAHATTCGQLRRKPSA
jgi:hypothetical protein